MKTNKYIFISILVIGLAGCANREIVDMPNDLWVPEGWDDLAGTTTPAGECPPLSGVYVEPPEIWSTPGANYDDASLDENGFIVILPFNLSEKVDPVSTHTNIGNGEFEFIQTDDNEFRLLSIGRNGKKFENVFNSKKGDFYCRNGRMFFPKNILDRTDITGTYNLQYQDLIARDEAGDLLMIKIQAPYRGSILGFDPEFKYNFLKYRRKHK